MAQGGFIRLFMRLNNPQALITGNPLRAPSGTLQKERTRLLEATNAQGAYVTVSSVGKYFTRGGKISLDKYLGCSYIWGVKQSYRG
ncbi:hypothetical protein LCGC14_1522840 [marine sediment metagenome]|uniref:Uncharacterized protein n=1 Tax=marine sediment metagenome TaxID=412755 RepID=A0A0F9IY59_9ZZZZ